MPLLIKRFLGNQGTQGKMDFVSLDTVLRAIGECISVPESAKPGADEPVWVCNINESYCRYSGAAALLDHHLVTAQHSPLPRWLDMRDGTGYPRPGDSARDDGLKFLLEQARWYLQWLKFEQEFRMRRLNAVGRFASPPSGDDYVRDCPRMPDTKRVYEIGFDENDIGDFLDRASIPHVLTKLGAQETSLVPAAHDAAIGVHAGAMKDTHPPLSSSDKSAPFGNSAMPGSRVNKTAEPGRQSLIEKALRRAYDAAGEQRDDADEVFNQLIKLAIECPDKFHPLSGYENGQVMFWSKGQKTEYKKTAMREYVRRRSLKNRNG